MESKAKVQYILRRRPGQKNIYLRIQPDGQLLVTAGPFVSEAYIDTFVEGKRDWYQKRISTRSLEHNYRDGDVFHLLGRTLVLEVVVGALRNECLTIGGRLVLMLRSSRVEDKARRKLISGEFSRRLVDFLEIRISYWAQKMGQDGKVSFRINNAVRQWASCSSSKVLTFSVKTASVEPDLVDYLIVHELAHTFHMNHGPRFKALVERTLPDWKARKDRLQKEYFDSFI